MQILEPIDLTKIPSDRICNTVDQGIRHKSGITDRDYLRAFLRISRPLGCATQDGNWGEFEKEFAIIVMRMVKAERALVAYRALHGEMA